MNSKEGEFQFIQTATFRDNFRKELPLKQGRRADWEDKVKQIGFEYLYYSNVEKRLCLNYTIFKPEFFRFKLLCRLG